VRCRHAARCDRRSWHCSSRCCDVEFVSSPHACDLSQLSAQHRLVLHRAALVMRVVANRGRECACVRVCVCEPDVVIVYAAPASSNMANVTMVRTWCALLSSVLTVA
jgi:hypothetical protein